MRCHRLAAAILSVSYALFSGAHAQPAAPGAERDVYIIYDSSNSMWGALDDGERKYEAADAALATFLETDFGDRNIALRIYGKNTANDCADTELAVPFAPASDAKAAITTAMRGVRPKGRTPIDRSLRAALADIGERKSDIILITDGIESCAADPCALMEEWRDKDVGIRVHVVGLGLDEMGKRAMTCVAETSGAKYYDAQSTDGLAEALSDAGDAVLVETEPSPEPIKQAQGFALRINATDEAGRSFIVKGALLKDGASVQEVFSNFRNPVEAAGEYEIEVGVVLRDGTLYKPVRAPAVISEPGVTTVDIRVTRPAILSARFVEDGEEVRGSNVTASQHGAEAFKFRAFDEVLARPGDYDFNAKPNADNDLTLAETLVEGEHTVLVFDVTKTIAFYVRFKLPNGETFKRGSELWRDGERVYKVFGSNNATTVRPGVYELRSEDQNLPLTPVEIEIKTDGETIEVPVDAGWVAISYAPSEFDYIGKPNRAWIESLERGGKKYARLDTPIPVKPGRYRANPQTSKGFFDPVDIEVATNETAEAVFTPKPLGEIIVNYAPSDNYQKQPDRASVNPLDGQEFLNGFMRPGIAKKFLPGRYNVKPSSAAGEIAPQEVTVIAGETTIVTLRLAGE